MRHKWTYFTKRFRQPMWKTSLASRWFLGVKMGLFVCGGRCHAFALRGVPSLD